MTSNIEKILRGLLDQNAGSIIDVEYDDIDIVYVTAGNGLGQIESATYKLGNKEQLKISFTYDANDDVINVHKTKY